MSYRSDIRITTTEEGFNILNDNINIYLKTHNLGLGNNLLSLLDINKHKYNMQRYFGWNNIIWLAHLHSADVDAILYGLKKLKENNVPYRFTRIGEDLSDTEEIISDDDFRLDYIDTYRKFID